MSENVWGEEFSVLEDSASTDTAFLDVWNRNVIPWMEQRGIEYKRVAHAYATKRGFVFDKEKHAYVIPCKMEATRGKNLIGVGWRDGVLRCAFASKSGPRFYRSASIPVPVEVFQKLLKVPFPDKLYGQIVKGKYPMEREI